MTITVYKIPLVLYKDTNMEYYAPKYLIDLRATWRSVKVDKDFIYVEILDNTVLNYPDVETVQWEV